MGFPEPMFYVLETISMKPLPKKTGKEIWIKVRYAILRFMKSGCAFKKKDGLPMIFTLKTISEPDIGDQIQLHIRFHAIDVFHKEKAREPIDIDLYVSLDEWKKKLEDFL